MKFNLFIQNNWLLIFSTILGIGILLWSAYFIENKGYSRWNNDISIADTACNEIDAVVGLKSNTLLLTGQKQWKVVCIKGAQ